MIIKHNIEAMNANRQYGVVRKELTTTTEKLSSGYKINKAADDAAGLSISEKLRKQIRGLTQAGENAQDGISLLQIADGAMNEIHSILDRGIELSVQAANGTLSQTDKLAIQEEIDQLLTEIDGIQERTKFNEIYVLKGELDYIYKMSPNGFGPVGDLANWIHDGGALNNRFLSETYVTQQTYITTATVPSQTTVSIEHPAASLDFSSFNSEAAKRELIDSGFNTTCCTCDRFYSIEFTNDTTNSTETSGIHFIFKIGIGDLDPTVPTAANDLLQRIIAGTNNGWPKNHYTRLAADYTTNKLYIYDDRCNNPALRPTDVKSWVDWKYPSFSIHADTKNGAFGAGIYRQKYRSDVIGYTPLNRKITLQIGAESHNTMDIVLPSISSKSLGLFAVNVCKSGGPENAIDAFGKAKDSVSADRSRLGAYQNRLEHTVKNLDNVVENTTASESRIRDTDMAKEIVAYSMRNILGQVGQSMLAQTNQNRQGIMTLLAS